MRARSECRLLMLFMMTVFQVTEAAAQGSLQATPAAPKTIQHESRTNEFSAPAPQLQQLELGRTLSGELAEGKTDSYMIDLQAGQYVRLLYTQAQSATALTVSCGQGTASSVELHLQLVGGKRSGFREPVSWITSKTGQYRLDIVPLGKVLEPRGYQITLEEVRPTLPSDQSRLVAQSMLDQFRLFKSKSEYKEALASAESALSSAREAKDQEREVSALNAAASMYDFFSNEEKAVEYYEESLTIERALKDRDLEGRTTNNLGIVYMRMNKPREAIEWLKRALPIEEETHDLQTQGKTLANIAVAYHDLGQFDETIKYGQKALQVQREAKDRQGEGLTLGTLGTAYSSLSQYAKAIEAYEQGLAIDREVKDRQGEANALGNIGDTYLQLGQYEQAINYFEQTLAIMREVKFRGGEAETLTSLGDAYRALKQPKKAVELYVEAVKAIRETKDQSGEATTLIALGDGYRDLKQYKEAISVYEQALALSHGIHDRQGEGQAFIALGHGYLELGQPSKAVEFFQQALTTQREIKGVRSEESDTLTGMMDSWRALGRPRVAIFYGKESVNIIQSVRADIHSLSAQLQKGYLQGNEKPYHTLADLLITQGRLTEAEQVLNLLKEEEYFDFVRRDSSESSSLTQHADLTPDEAEWEKRYREVSDKFVALGTERGELLDRKSLTPTESARLAQLEKDLAAGNSAFERFLGELAEHFSTGSEATAKVQQLREAQGIMEDLRELPKGTVAIYTLVGEDKYRAILVTPDVQKAYEYPITGEDLNRQVLQFRRALQNPAVDPRPLGQEMYRVLLANLADDLKQAKAKTIMWSLDGTLRYLPVAALFDGKNYLVEQYALSVFTPASNARLKDVPSHEWQAAGFGVTKAHEGAPALPGVQSELTSIIEPKQGQGGILVGEIKLDDQFTEDSLRQTLLKHYPVVHIASHFWFQAGNETNSFLLLGDGNHLSLAELKNLPNLFGGVQLLTLSACNTGMGGSDANGKEVEGLGVLAQRKGAKAVVASLWPVWDVSTSLFMQEFYRAREVSSTTKVQALREAQLALLHGSAKLNSQSLADRALTHEHEENRQSEVQTPAFPVDEKRPYAHPYYWAPFFLMGNWL